MMLKSSRNQPEIEIRYVTEKGTPGSEKSSKQKTSEPKMKVETHKTKRTQQAQNQSNRKAHRYELLFITMSLIGILLAVILLLIKRLN